jgi:hypothetical protein
MSQIKTECLAEFQNILNTQSGEAARNAAISYFNSHCIRGLQIVIDSVTQQYVTLTNETKSSVERILFHQGNATSDNIALFCVNDDIYNYYCLFQRL